MKLFVRYLILFFVLSISIIFVLGGHNEVKNQIKFDQVKASPGFVLGMPSKIITTGIGSFKSHSVAFDYEVAGKRYQSKTTKTDYSGALEYFTDMKYWEIAYDTRNPEVSMLRHYYDHPSRQGDTLVRILFLVAIMGSVPALILTLLAAAFVWAVKRIKFSS